MIFNVEGTDHAGKTTLAYRVAYEFLHGPVLSGLRGKEVTRIHRGPPDDRHILEQYEGDLLQYPAEELASLGHLFILDRWHLGEWLYGPLLRGSSRLTRPQLLHVEMLLDALGATRRLVVAGPASLERRHTAAPDPLVTFNQALSIQTSYRNLVSSLHAWQTTDMSDGREPDAHKILLEMVIKTAFAAQVAGNTTYVGPPLPHVLLVGDRPGGHPPGWVRAFTPLSGGSASALLAALYNRSAIWDTGFANQEGTDLTGLWYDLNMPNVITLGRAAEDAVKASGIRHDQRLFTARHPQYVRRFDNGNWGDYITNLTEMINA